MTEKTFTEMGERLDGRHDGQLREFRIERDFNRYAEGSVLVTCGNTRVICTASVEEKVPSFLRGSGQGWVTAEYAMLPRATASRGVRDSVKGKIGGRSHEIQRLIGRSLRAGVDLGRLGERTIWVDCDVIQADGGTRTTAITGAFVALVDALRHLRNEGKLTSIPVESFIAAVSVGKVEGRLLLDLCYEEDSGAEVDCNVVRNGAGEYIEVQGTGEGGTFSRSELTNLLDLAESGLNELQNIQRLCLEMSAEEEALLGTADDRSGKR